jgi:hypothetical protein
MVDATSSTGEGGQTIMGIDVSVAWGLLALQPAVAFVGLVLNVFRASEALEDVRFTDSGLRSKHLAARKVAEDELTRVTVDVLLVFIGLVTVVNPPDHIDRPSSVIMIRSALMLVSLIMASKPIRGGKYYQRLIGRLAVQERQRRKKRVRGA